VAQVLQLGQQLEGGVDVAALDGNARACGVAGDHGDAQHAPFDE